MADANNATMTATQVIQIILGSSVIAALISTVVGGIFAYFNTKTVKEQELANSRAVAEFSSKLAQAEHAFKTQFSSLYIKRAEFIDTLHTDVIAVEDKFKEYLNPGKRDAPKDEDARTAAVKAAVDFDRTNIKSELYFGASTREALERFRLLLVEVITRNRLLLPHGSEGDINNAEWVQLFQTIMDRLVPARQRIEKEFRDILGVKD